MSTPVFGAAPPGLRSSRRTLAVVNPAAGGGRCGRMARDTLEAIRAGGAEVEVVETTRSGEGSEIARARYAEGVRRFLAVGGDGTSFEILNGVFPAALTNERVALGFLPLGTGNSFLRDFVRAPGDAIAHSLEAIGAGRTRRCDVLRLRHRGGEFYYINLLSMGFTADVAAVVNRRFKALGEAGYLLGVVVCLARLRRRAFPVRADDDAEPDRRACLFLSFSNSKFTGGKMMIAPDADPTDGLIEYVRWGPIGRAGLMGNLPGLYDGSHIRHPLAERRGVRRVSFELAEAVDVMVDGEVKRLDCREVEVLPAALDVLA